ncbi:hypothetical protein, partial [Neisseria sicca]|uniref:hypothetical protein n=1 Tax=Neisseria sicca TaxID=490 RepID=UPI001C9A00B6
FEGEGRGGDYVGEVGGVCVECGGEVYFGLGQIGYGRFGGGRVGVGEDGGVEVEFGLYFGEVLLVEGFGLEGGDVEDVGGLEGGLEVGEIEKNGGEIKEWGKGGNEKKEMQEVKGEIDFERR